MKKDNTNDVVVSIVCNAYNHEKYIADAIEGFVMQKANFGFEILIHDDASTDHTADIIREYEKRYPELIKPIYQTENQYSKKEGSVLRIQYGRAKGEYIALCEGDDYWTDSLKLQKQVDALKAHPECDMCAHGAVTIDAETQREIYRDGAKGCDRILNPEDVIAGGGGYLTTNSLMFRKSLLDTKWKFREIIKLDYTLQILGSLRGGIVYLEDTMSVYRLGVQGSWTQRMAQDVKKRIQHRSRIFQMFETLNAETGYKYDATIQREIMRTEIDTLDLSGNGKEIFKKKYKKTLKEMPREQVAKYWIKAYLPCIYRIYKRRR